MGIRDDLFGFFGSLTGPPDEPTSLLGGSIDTILTIVLIVAVLFGVIILGRGVKHLTSYAGYGEELGSFKLHVMGKSMVKGNMNVHEDITEDELDMLEAMNEIDIKENTKSYRARMAGKELYVYDFRITDYDEAWDLKGGRDAIVTSAVPLENEKYFYMDDKGDRSIVSPTFRQKSRNVFAFITSEYHPEYVDPYGKLKDIYDLVVIPKSLTVMMKNGRHGYEVGLFMKKLESGVSDALRAEFLKTIAESYKKIEPSQKETDRLRDKLHEKDKEISDVHIQAGDHRAESFTHPIIGFSKKPAEFSKGSILGIVLFATFMGGLGYGMPELIPSLQGIIQPFVGMAIMMVIMFLIVNAYYEKKPQKEKEEMGLA